MTATPVSDLAGRLQQELEREHQRHFKEWGDDPLAWLAFVPLWTDRVARASRFPERPLPLPEFLARAEAAGWCVRKAEPGPRTPYLRLEVAVDLFPHADPRERSEQRWKAIEEEVVAIPDEAVRASLTARLLGSPPERARSPVREAGSLDDADPVRAARALRQAAGELPEREVDIRANFLLWKLASAPAAPRAVALGDVATALARKELTDQTLRVAEQIEDARVRAAALGELVAALGLAAKRSGPVLDTVVEQCWRAATGADGSLDPTVAAGFAGQLAAAGRDDDVRRLATEALAVAERAVPTPALVGAMQRIADALDAVNHQRRPFNLRYLNVVLRLASGIGDPVARAAALASAAAWMGRFDPRPEVYGPISSSGLLDAARAIEHGEDRVRALARVVPLLPQGLRREVADEALALAGQLEEAAGAVTFWMPDTARAAVIEELRRRRDFRWLQQTAGRIGASVREAARSVAVPAPLARWAELAVAALTYARESPAQQPIDPPTLSSQAAASHLDRRIAELLAAGDTGQALTWLDTARSLSPLLLGEFEVSVLANTRRVELVHRRWLDRRRLERFLPRAEQLGAFEDLLDQPDGAKGAWALHYLGVGGVGKTMLIRHLTAELAPARDALTSRIDFDHLNPDFPRRRPAQLVVELAAELEAQAQGTRLIGLYRQAYEALQEVNARAQPVTVEDEDFAKALRTFAGFLQALGRRVVLILDTCEELEKFRPAGGRLEQLEATFEVLEALHRQVPTLRVVLAGRRPLARSGRGWRLADLAGRRHALLPASKPYLLLHEVRGFDPVEAEEFLTRRAGLRPDPELLAAILERSPDPGTAADVEWDDGHQPPEAPRYNPFDLDLIAGWVRGEPDLTIAELRASRSDLYVETRIVGRLKNPDVERLLPAVVALGRFDQEMLLPAFDLGEQALADAERDLASAEWIDVQRDEALDTTFLEVDRNLRPRLEAYFRREHPGLLREAARRLAPGLSRLVGDPERPLSRLGFDHVDAALRLLPPAEAARLVDRLAMRVVEEAAAQEGAWGWAATVTERLLAEGSPLAEPDHPAGAGLRAMLASALRHLNPQRDLSELWAVVEQSAHNHPDPEIAEWLAQRAYLQLLVAASGEDTLERLLASLRVRPTPQAQAQPQTQDQGAPPQDQPNTGGDVSSGVVHSPRPASARRVGGWKRAGRCSSAACWQRTAACWTCPRRTAALPACPARGSPTTPSTWPSPTPPRKRGTWPPTPSDACSSAVPPCSRVSLLSRGPRSSRRSWPSSGCWRTGLCATRRSSRRGSAATGKRPRISPPESCSKLSAQQCSRSGSTPRTRPNWPTRPFGRGSKPCRATPSLWTSSTLSASPSASAGSPASALAGSTPSASPLPPWTGASQAGSCLPRSWSATSASPTCTRSAGLSARPTAPCRRSSSPLPARGWPSAGRSGHWRCYNKATSPPSSSGTSPPSLRPRLPRWRWSAASG